MNAEAKQILKENGLVSIKNRLYGDRDNPGAARAFVARLLKAADDADRKALPATRYKAEKLRQNARAARKEATQILSTL